MEEHRIKIKIADRIYSQTVSEDKEAAIRKAARSVDETIREYSRNFPEVSQLDIATVVALNAAMECERLREELDNTRGEIERVGAALKQYVESLK